MKRGQEARTCACTGSGDMKGGQEARTLSGDKERAQEARTRSVDRMLGHEAGTCSSCDTPIFAKRFRYIPALLHKNQLV